MPPAAPPHTVPHTMLRTTSLLSRVAVSAAPLGSRGLRASAPAMDRVLLADGIDAVAAKLLTRAGHTVDEKPKLSKEELLECVHEYDAVVVRSASKITEEVLAKAPRLKVVGRAGTGTDNIDSKAASNKGVLVVNTPGGNTRSAAELAVSLMANLVRRVPDACYDLKHGEWARSKYAKGTELSGKTLGIIGCGRIGQVVSQYSKALGLHVIGVDDMMDYETMAELGIEKVDFASLKARSDLITVHVPGGEGTRHIINKEFFDDCKDGVFLINAARGGVVDEAALLEALDSGKVAGAALDVFQNEPKAPDFAVDGALKELVSHPLVISTPHLGASTEEAQTKVAHDIAQQLCDGLAGLDWVGVVNAPHVSMAADPALQPWVTVADTVGSLVYQLVPGGHVKNVSVSVRDDSVFAKEAGEVMRTAVLRGMLNRCKDVSVAVNLVNADSLSAARGWESSADLAPSPSDNAAELTVRIDTDHGSRCATGLLIAGKPYVKQIDEWPSFPVFKADGNFLFYSSIDKPGMIAPVVGVLAQNNINVSNMGTARPSIGRPAFVFIQYAGNVNRAILEKVESIPGIAEVTEVSL